MCPAKNSRCYLNTSILSVHHKCCFCSTAQNYSFVGKSQFSQGLLANQYTCYLHNKGNCIEEEKLVIRNFPHVERTIETA